MRVSRYFFPEKGKEGDYLGVDLVNSIRAITLALFRGITFDANLNSFEATVDIDSGAEVTIQNELRIIPNEWFVVDAINGGPLVRGQKEWTLSDISLLNIGPSGTFKVRFFFTGLRG